MKLIISPPPAVETRVKKDGEPYKQREWNPVADNEKTRTHLYALVAQRIARYAEPGYCSDDMFRGFEDEIDAKAKYQEHYGEIEDCGFITNDKWGFTLGYSPDSLVVKDDGLIEIKSRAHRFQAETILVNVADNTIPAEFLIQVQTGLLVSERKWLDFISYSAGMFMAVVRVYPDQVIQDAIVAAASAFEEKMTAAIIRFAEITQSGARLIPTERRVEQEIHL
jgi:hypothetical protein